MYCYATSDRVDCYRDCLPHPQVNPTDIHSISNWNKYLENKMAKFMKTVNSQLNHPNTDDNKAS